MCASEKLELDMGISAFSFGAIHVEARIFKSLDSQKENHKRHEAIIK